ncbi:hypothetical protein GGI07_005326 [Coemansia sp. Benny D115]|nr:hypothetical protein GGI07_005326 [Coemansia sp. Benny D115]
MFSGSAKLPKAHKILYFCVALIAIFGQGTGASIPIHNLSKRIYGGFVVPQTMAPFVVSVRSSVGLVSEMCGGSLISSRHVVTAAHCVLNSENELYPPENVTIGYSTTDKDSQKFAKGTKVSVYPGAVKDGNLDMTFDIAIVEIPEITFGPTVQPIGVFDDSLEAGQKVLTMGWGMNESKDIDDSVLRGLIVKIDSVEECNKKNSASLTKDGSAVCSLGSDSPGRSICSGDSGTGVVVNQNGRLKLAALNSQITRMQDGLKCGHSDASAFYLRIGYFVDFIVKATGLSKEYLTS